MWIFEFSGSSETTARTVPGPARAHSKIRIQSKHTSTALSAPMADRTPSPATIVATSSADSASETAPACAPASAASDAASAAAAPVSEAATSTTSAAAAAPAPAARAPYVLPKGNRLHTQEKPTAYLHSSLYFSNPRTNTAQAASTNRQTKFSPLACARAPPNSAATLLCSIAQQCTYCWNSFANWCVEIQLATALRVRRLIWFFSSARAAAVSRPITPRIFPMIRPSRTPTLTSACLNLISKARASVRVEMHMRPRSDSRPHVSKFSCTFLTTCTMVHKQRQFRSTCF